MNLKDKHVIVCVISDLVTDQRVHRTSVTLTEENARVTLVGRRLSGSLPLDDRAYRTRRFSLWFEKGPLFYASYNIRLFVYLLSERADIIVANDLDTLPACFLASALKRSKLVYDSHEYFTEVPELVSRPFVKRFWKRIERFIFPKLKNVITVNASIATLYEKEYGIPVGVVRNIPPSFMPESISEKVSWRDKLHLPADKTIFILQGAGINIQRGAEEALEAMQYVKDGILLFVGGGDVVEILKKQTVALNLNEKVRFVPKLRWHELRSLTAMADAGLTLDKDTNVNYRYSLPNKLFDYIHAQIPVIASDLPEVKKIVTGYDIGCIIRTHDPRELAAAMDRIRTSKTEVARWKENLKLAAAELNWETEKKQLLLVFENVR